MSKKDKLIKRLTSKPKDFEYNELRTLLKHLGFIENNRGKTSGSAVRFYNNQTNRKIEIHKPHPGNILKMYQIEDIIEELKEYLAKEVIK